MSEKNTVTDKQAPLREDVRLLGNLLGKTLISKESKKVYDQVEEIRALSKKARNSDTKARNKLKKMIRSLEDEETLKLSRAFGHFLNLANIAETYHSLRTERNTAEDALTAQVNKLSELIPSLLEKGIDKYDIFETISEMDIELVLTAHPTEVKRRTLIQKHGRITNYLRERDRIHLTPYEKEDNNLKLETLVNSVWQTDEIRRVRPTPVEEARWGLAIIEEVLWHAVPDFIDDVDRIMQKHLGKKLPLFSSPVRIASWMGGDRDGNPNVTSAVTKRVVMLSRWMAADLYYREIDQLIQRLSMEDCSEEIRAEVGNVREPYRVYLRNVRSRMAATRDWCDAEIKGIPFKSEHEVYLDVNELIQPLKVCYKSLVDTKAELVANASLLKLIRRVATFGLTLVRLDIRQESTRHTDVINAITEYIGIGSYKDWDEKKRTEFLVKECQSKRPLLPANMPLTEDQQEVIDTVKVVASLPSDSFGAYVISMASTPSDVLAVRLLQKEAGIPKPLRVVPLFETLDDLRNCDSVMNELFSNKWYKKDINGDQEVMIGYSDSGKDAGKLAASWAQYQAQGALMKIAKKHKIRMNLFHGRGGSVGRGGGPVEHALLAQAPGTVDGRMRVTEQGEVIQQKYSYPEVAVYNLSQYVTAVLEATLSPPRPPKAKWIEVMDMMSEISCDVYRGVVRGHKDFVEYFRQVTPEQELGRLYIGSRPAKRKKGGGIESLRAIPWVFAWTQIRLMLPAWLGTGDALTKAVEQFGRETLQEMIEEWPFFYFFMDMLDMVLTKADVSVAEYYDECLASEKVVGLGTELRERLQKTIDIADEIVNGMQVKKDRESLRASVKVRNIYADPINLLQGEVLRRLKTKKYENLSVLEDALMVTIAGIAAAMKNTG